MFDCQSCDEFIHLSKRLQPISDLQHLRHYYTNCKECNEFCKDCLENALCQLFRL